MARLISELSPTVPEAQVEKECSPAPPPIDRRSAGEQAWTADIRRGASAQTDPDVLARLAKSHVWARWAVAANPVCPVELLWQLAKDEVPLVRHAVASNPSTSDNVRRFLATDPDCRVSG